MAYLSLLGLYQYDNDLFAEMVLPESIDRDNFLTNLLAEVAELEVIYPDGEIMRQMIGAWSAIRLSTWERMEFVLTEEYDPFINIKRDEVRTIESEGQNVEGVSAWNVSTFVNRNQNTGSSLVTETFHVEGDSAITDAQDVARKEIELRAKYDLYQIIIAEFKNRFCLAVY